MPRNIRHVSSYAQAERAALADLLTELGPEAPTLCVGWTTRDLAAHLVLRERRPDAAGGIAIKRLAPRTARVQAEIAGGDWPQLIDKVRHRPIWSLISNPLLDEATNRFELFIHHEDVRRAQPEWRPREMPPEFSELAWRRVRTLARLVLRKVPATVTVTAEGHGEVTVGKGGPATVRLSGPPEELLLFLQGRQEHALVDLDGPESVVSRLRRARLGL
jgi:uncharacterized protein (TIGR03085 family)